MPSSAAVLMDDDEPTGRKTPVTQKVNRREDRAIRTMAEVWNRPVSSLLHEFGVGDLVAQYERVIAVARLKVLPAIGGTQVHQE